MPSRRPEAAVGPSGQYFWGQRKHTKKRKEHVMSAEQQPLLLSQEQEDLAVLSVQLSGPHLSKPLHPSRHKLANGHASGASSGANLNRVPLINSPDLRLRFLMPSDLNEIKRLCLEWFPIEYPDSWYNDITSNPTNRFYSVACVYHDKIVGLVVAEIKDYFTLPKEDSEILASTFRRGTKIGYILSLGVVKDMRKNGIASFMLDNLLAHLTSSDNSDVRAVYLHVLTTNSQAIRFYENRGFKWHLFLPLYYNIKGKRKDGFTYVLYVNGGHPPWNLCDYAVHCCSLMCSVSPVALARGAMKRLSVAWWYTFLPRVRRIAQSSAAIFS